MPNEGRRWFEQRKEFVGRVKQPGEEVTPDLFTKCPSCGETLFNEVLAQNLQVCHLCRHHFPLGAIPRLESLCDPGTMTSHDDHLEPIDALGFVDSHPYAKR